MTASESKELSIGQRVSWISSLEFVGRVLSVDTDGVEIEWNNGQRDFRHHTNMGDIHLLEMKD
jgi:hypothetical protein